MDQTADGLALERIRQDDRTILKEIYKRHHGNFVRWANWRYACSPEEVAEVYQQAFTIFYFNVKEGKFTGANSSIQTYLYGIAKNLIHKKLASRGRTESLDANEVELPADDLLAEFDIMHRESQVAAILAKAGEPCRSILLKYYFDNFTMEAIAENLGYKTADVVKKKKCECLNKLRKLLKEEQSKAKAKNRNRV